jgi:hypothetical protein
MPEVDLKYCHCYDFGQYAGNTSNRLRKAKQGCSNCREPHNLTFIQKSTEEPNKGYMLCRVCLGFYHAGDTELFEERAKREYLKDEQLKMEL